MPEQSSRARRLSCEEAAALSAELALGALSGDERAAALSHVSECGPCRGELAGLSQAADTLLLAAGEEEPPLGFEVRFGEAVRPSLPERAPARGGRRLPLVLAATLLLAGTGAGIGIREALSSRPAPLPAAAAQTSGVRLAALELPGRRQAGVAAVSLGRPGWVVVKAERLSGAYWVRCVVRAGARAVTVGTFTLKEGSGSWSVRLPGSVHSSFVTSLLLFGPGGALLASASFRPPAAR